MNRPDQLRSHLVRARENGVTEEELIEASRFAAGPRLGLTVHTETDTVAGDSLLSLPL